MAATAPDDNRVYSSHSLILDHRRVATSLHNPATAFVTMPHPPSPAHTPTYPCALPAQSASAPDTDMSFVSSAAVWAARSPAPVSTHAPPAPSHALLHAHPHAHLPADPWAHGALWRPGSAVSATAAWTIGDRLPAQSSSHQYAQQQQQWFQPGMSAISTSATELSDSRNNVQATCDVVFYPEYNTGEAAAQSNPQQQPSSLQTPPRQSPPHPTRKSQSHSGQPQPTPSAPLLHHRQRHQQQQRHLQAPGYPYIQQQSQQSRHNQTRGLPGPHAAQFPNRRRRRHVGTENNYDSSYSPNNTLKHHSSSAYSTSTTSNSGNSSQSVREYNRRISACARRRDLTGALNALAELDASPYHRNPHTLNAIINCLVMCHERARADQLWHEMVEAGIRPNLVSWNTRLKSCFGGTDSDVERAFSYLRAMEHSGIAPDRVTLNSVLNACVTANHVDEALRVYEEMRQRNIEPDLFTFTTLAKAGAAHNDIELLDSLLVHTLNHHTKLSLASTPSCPPLSPVCFSTIADAYIRCGHPLRAIELLNCMVEEPKSIPVAPDTQSINVYLKALRESGSPAKAAFNILQKMSSLGIESDHITLLTLADLCCRRGELGLAEGVLRVATDSDVREAERRSPEWAALPLQAQRGNGSSSHIGSGLGGGRRNTTQPRNAKGNAALFNCVIRGFTSSLDTPNVDAAVRLYGEMRRFVQANSFWFYSPDAVTYTMLVDAFARIGDSVRAEQIVAEMEAIGPTTVAVYNALLKLKRCRGQGSKQAFAVLDRIKARGLQPDIVTCNQLLDILSTEDNGLAMAEKLLTIDMPRYNVQPDVQSFNILLKCTVRSKNQNNTDPAAALHSAYRWLREIRRRNLRADEYTYNCLVSLAAAAGDAPLALEFFHCVNAERRTRPGGTAAWSASTNNMAEMMSQASAKASRPSLGTQAPLPARSGHPSLLLGKVVGPASQKSVRHEPIPEMPASDASAPCVPSNAPTLSYVNENLIALGEGCPVAESQTGGAHSDDESPSVSDAIDRSAVPHVSSYVSLMRAMLSSDAGGVDSVLKLRDEMIERGLELGRPGYSAVADAFASVGNVEKVDATLAEMQARDPNGLAAIGPVQHCIRMKAMCNAGRLDDAIAILTTEKDLDAACFNLALFQCVNLDDRHRTIAVLRAMEAASVSPDAISYKAMSGFMHTLARALKTFDEKFRDRITKLALADDQHSIEVQLESLRPIGDDDSQTA
jgi:pentatricopeptide repeat protein